VTLDDAMPVWRQSLFRFEALLRRWYHLRPANCAVAILLLLFACAWTLFQVLSNASIGIHPDLGEIYDWSRHPAPGYYKHPPLPALMAWVWFSIFPAQDWSFYLFAILNATLALFAVDLIARRYLPDEKRLLVIPLLLLTPFYQFHASIFSTNQSLLSTWPLATYCFLQAFERRSIAWSIATGVTAALAMQGKYYSVFLLGSFVLAALGSPERGRYLKSSSPWISAAAGAATLAPHCYWLVTTGFQPFSYAYSLHESSLLTAIKAIVPYLIGGAAYVSVLVAAYLLAARPDRNLFARAIWPTDSNRQMLVLLLAGQVLLPPILSPLLHLQITNLWTMSAWFLLPIVLLGPIQIVVREQRAIQLFAGVAGFTIIALIAAPSVAWIQHVTGTRQGREYYRPLSLELTQQWRTATARPLSLIYGQPELIGAIAFYSPDHPDAVPAPGAAPWVAPDRAARDGWAFVCMKRWQWCDELFSSRVPNGSNVRQFELEIVPRFIGHAGKSEIFRVAFISPMTAKQ
jgi:4-amino-4-deoxy-L-arabinose transferase-like glycosyltransferase